MFANLRCIVVKLTSRCNIQCEYCYEDITFGKEKHYNMEIENFKKITNRIFAESKKDSMTVLFHGGEPSLLPISWIDAACSHVRQLAITYNKKLSIDIQSNFIKITDEMMSCLKRNNISIGVSIDNPATMPSSMRPLAEKVIENFLRARKIGLKCGILTTINKSNYNLFDSICEWLSSEMGCRSFKANVAYPVGKGTNLSPITAEEIFVAKKSMIDYIISTDAEHLVEHNIVNSMIYYIDCAVGSDERKPSLCGSKTCGAGKEVIGLTPEGHVLPCGRFAWNEEEHYLGSLFEKNSKEEKITYNKKLKKFHSLASENWKDCNTCSAKPICEFSCQAFIVRSSNKINLECEATKKTFFYFESIRKKIENIYPKLKLRTYLNRLFDVEDLNKFFKSSPDEKRLVCKNLENIFIIERELKTNNNLSSDDKLAFIQHLDDILKDTKNRAVTQTGISC